MAAMGAYSSVAHDRPRLLIGASSVAVPPQLGRGWEGPMTEL